MENLIQSLTDQKIVTISQSDFIALVKDYKKSTIVNAIYLVDDNRSKTRNKKKLVQKLVQVSKVFLNHDYKKKVEKLTDTEFIPLPRKGKKVISNTIVQSNKDKKLMLSGKILPKYGNCTTIISLFTNGKKITAKEGEILDLWTPSYYKPKTQKTAGRGTVKEEDNFFFCEPKIENLKFCRFLGTWYKIK